MKAADPATVWVRAERKKKKPFRLLFFAIHCFGPSGVSGRFC